MKKLNILVLVLAFLSPRFALSMESDISKEELNQPNVLLALNAAIRNLNFGNFNTNNLLIEAAKNGHKDTVQLLIKLGVGINSRDNNNSTALHWAAFFWREDIVELLIQSGADLTIQDNEGETPLISAIVGKMHSENKNLRVYRLLIDALESNNLKSAFDMLNSEGLSALHLAVRDNIMDLVILLAKAGANLNLLTSTGETSLDLAVLNGHILLIDLLLSYQVVGNSCKI